jgi:holo-[acyl-carrier protein] synthase
LIIGIGIDIVDMEEFRKRLTPALLDELFLSSEKAYSSSLARPWENFAVRFAAKEAAFKALGQGLSQGLSWQDVEVRRDEATGRVWLDLHGRAERLAEEKGVGASCLSLSHNKRSAIAIVIMEGSE